MENETISKANYLDSDVSGDVSPSVKARSGWLGVGTVAVASALVGGLAAAWYYRKTLARLREAEELADEAPGADHSYESLDDL